METSEGIRLRDFAVEATKPSQSPNEQLQARPPENPLNFWSKYIRLKIDEQAWRDHLALERTYLAYIRTASAYAQFGVVLAQLFRLNVSSKGATTPTTLRIGNALGATTEGIAIVVLLTGTLYWWRQQRGLAEGTTLAGGFHSPVIVGLSAVLFIIIFALLVAADKW